MAIKAPSGNIALDHQDSNFEASQTYADGQVPEQVDQHEEPQLHNGSVNDVFFITYDEMKKESIQNLFIMFENRTVMIRYCASNVSLGWLKDKLLQQYPDNFLVNPTFSANNTALPHGELIVEL